MVYGGVLIRNRCVTICLCHVTILQKNPIIFVTSQTQFFVFLGLHVYDDICVDFCVPQ